MLPLYTSAPTSRGILNILSPDYNTQSAVFPATLSPSNPCSLFIPLTSTSSPYASTTSGKPLCVYRRTKTSLPRSMSVRLSLRPCFLCSSWRNSCGYLALANGYCCRRCCCPCSCSCLSLTWLCERPSARVSDKLENSTGLASFFFFSFLFSFFFFFLSLSPWTRSA